VTPKAVPATPALVSFRKSRREALGADIEPPSNPMRTRQA
jgi:hypothetical protein